MCTARPIPPRSPVRSTRGPPEAATISRSPSPPSWGCARRRVARLSALVGWVSLFRRACEYLLLLGCESYGGGWLSGALLYSLSELGGRQCIQHIMLGQPCPPCLQDPV